MPEMAHSIMPVLVHYQLAVDTSTAGIPASAPDALPPPTDASLRAEGAADTVAWGRTKWHPRSSKQQKVGTLKVFPSPCHKSPVPIVAFEHEKPDKVRDKVRDKGWNCAFRNSLSH